MKTLRVSALILLSFILTSCIVSTAAKVVKTTAKIGIGVVKGTVKGVAWTVKKAEGKINEDRIDGVWKVVGVYSGTYEQFSTDSNPENNFKSTCANGLEVIEFNSKREKFKPVHCTGQDEEWIKYGYKFGKNPMTGTLFFDRDNKPNMLNVAVSRAKDNFIVFANTRILKKNAKTPSGVLANFLKYEVTAS